MTRKQIDEKQCKICKAVFPDESDLIDDIYTQRKRGDTVYNSLLGSFCHQCRPPSAYIHPKYMIYVVDRLD